MRRKSYVRVFEIEEELLRHAPQEHRDNLRSHVTVPALELPRGPLEVSGESSGQALIVIDGALSRHVDMFGHRTSEVLGPGDVILPAVHLGVGQHRFPVGWSALTESRLGELDLAHDRRLRGVPGLAAALLERHQRRLETMTLQVNLARRRGIPTRLLIYLWHLAERLGDRRGHEVTLKVPLGHALLAELVSAERASVSRGLAVLKSLNYIKAGQRQCWTLCGGTPPDFDRVELELDAHRGQERSVF